MQSDRSQKGRVDVVAVPGLARI